MKIETLESLFLIFKKSNKSRYSLGFELSKTYNNVITYLTPNLEQLDLKDVKGALNQKRINEYCIILFADRPGGYMLFDYQCLKASQT